VQRSTAPPPARAEERGQETHLLRYVCGGQVRLWPASRLRAGMIERLQTPATLVIISIIIIIIITPRERKRNTNRSMLDMSKKAKEYNQKNRKKKRNMILRGHVYLTCHVTNVHLFFIRRRRIFFFCFGKRCISSSAFNGSLLGVLSFPLHFTKAEASFFLVLADCRVRSTRRIRSLGRRLIFLDKSNFVLPSCRLFRMLCK
jgi:hypothetical protein